MHPINSRNFGAKAGKLAVKFNDGSSVVTGWIVAQVGTKRYKVTNGTTTGIRTLAQTSDELTALATGPNNLCTIEIVNYNGSVTEHVQKLTRRHAITVEGNLLQFARGVAAAANGFGTVAVVANATPTVANVIPDQVATVAALFTYTFPANTFADLNGDTLTYTATKGDNSALPVWLVFDGPTRTFTKAATAGVTGTVAVKVIANDGTATVTDTFNLVVS